VADPQAADPQAASLRRAAVMIDLGRYRDAAALLAGALASAPDSGRAWCLLSRAHLGDDNPGRAITAATRASALDPADDWPYRLVSTALISLGQYDDAVTAAVQARRLAPHFWRSHVCLAQAAAAAGQHELAVQAASRALAIAPGEADVHVTAGKAALSRGDLAEARRRQEAALAIEPSNSSAINELGRISLRANDAASAAGHFIRAARSDPGAGIFGRNTELALTRLGLRMAITILLALAALTMAVLLALRGDGPAAAVFGLFLVFFAARAAVAVLRLPPAARRHLARAMWNRRGQLAGDLVAALGGPWPRTQLRKPG
jgi:tetratricopeptide (TPR) repeat protein